MKSRHGKQTILSGYRQQADMKQESSHQSKFKSNAKIITISSGKGGVGKTLSTIKIATALAKAGKKILVIDGDMGLSNVDIVLGLNAVYNINDVLESQVGFNEILLEGPLGIAIASSGSGLQNLTRLSQLEKDLLLQAIRKNSENYDCVIIDTGAGIGDNVLGFCNASQYQIVVTTPEIHALTDAYALIKTISSNSKNTKPIGLIVNFCHNYDESYQIYCRLANVCNQYLNRDIEYLGWIRSDESLRHTLATSDRSALLSDHTFISQQFSNISRDLAEKLDSIPGHQDVWCSIFNGRANEPKVQVRY